MKRTVVYVLEAGSVSGGVRVVYEHMNRLRARGWHVEVYSLDSNRPTWFPLDPGIPWLKFSTYGNLTRHLARRNAVKVATWWKTARPVAEASGPGEGFYFVQDIETSYYTAPAMKDAVMDTYDLPLTKFTDSICAQRNLDDCEFIGLGLDTNLYHPIDGIKRQLNAILSLSRPQRLKGWSLHCETYRKLYHTKEFTLYSFGTANVAPPYALQLPRGMPDEDLVRFYNRVGIFLSTSEHEGFSLGPLEAMACGAVAVTTNADGNMVYAQDDVNCVIVPDDADAIVNACLELINDTDRLIRLQGAGFETVQEWPWEPVINRLEQLYG